MSKKRIIPRVSALIDDCRIKIADGLHGKHIGINPTDLSAYLSMLLSVDKNDREVKASVAKEAEEWTDEELQREIDLLVKKVT